MQFLYDEHASQDRIVITGENHKYLFKVRRFEVGEKLFFRNLQDEMLYQYVIEDVRKREADLVRVDAYHDTKCAEKFLHLIWCMIDVKVIEKTLPMLNQVGVAKISFVYCERSQKNFKVDIERLKKILINSSQQCGRSNLMELEVLSSIEEIMAHYPDFSVLDFGGDTVHQDITSIMIGCEGGFTENEREKLQNRHKIGLKSPFILKSETAALTLASKLLI